MRVILALVLVLCLGCEEPTPEGVKRESTFVGDWVSVGGSESDRIKVSFSDGGEVTISSAAKKPNVLRYRVESFDSWLARRKSELALPKGSEELTNPGVTHVITAFDAKSPEEFNPSRNYFYEKAADRLTVSGMIEFRRAR